jgi:preprotein translocase subunit SecG
MVTIITVLHVVAAIFLVLIVLLQSGKGASLGASFGGASQTVFGASGAGNFLTKLTAVSAIVFMCTSLTLAYFSTHTASSLEKEMMKKAQIMQSQQSQNAAAPAEGTTPAVPAAPAVPAQPATPPASK